ncbi:MAG TPA: hypothetical protein PKW21_15470 [Rhabdaerophilum sp.]|nr:hypothetical protein [Rhabdaerophilum sp.]
MVFIHQTGSLEREARTIRNHLLDMSKELFETLDPNAWIDIEPVRLENLGQESATLRRVRVEPGFAIARNQSFDIHPLLLPARQAATLSCSRKKKKAGSPRPSFHSAACCTG